MTDTTKAREFYRKRSSSYTPKMDGSDRYNLMADFAAQCVAEDRGKGCPCLYLKQPCRANCTCTDSGSSAGCLYCVRYGSLAQRQQRAHDIAAALNERAELLAEVERLKAMVRELPEAIPTTWLDSLLTGPDAVVDGKREGFDCREIEALLRGIQDRLRARSKAALDEIEAMRRGDGEA